MTERVLVTGGTGFIASWAIRQLLERGDQVRTTARTAAKADALRATHVGLEVAVADLSSDEGWPLALDGVQGVLHVASPIGQSAAGQSEDVMVATARDGALRVLRAAAGAGVRRVVMTSAANTASPSSYAEESVSDETVWTDPADPTLTPYRRSKTVAERSAWDWIAEHEGSPELATVLPGAVFGPVLSSDGIGSVSIVKQMLTGGMRGVPRIGLEAVDVRDLAAAHLLALDVPEAAGQRFLATGEFIWMRDMARALREELGADGARVSTRQAPDLVVRLMARFRSPALRDIVPALGRRAVHSTAKAERVLGWHARPAREAVVDAGRSLVELGVV